METDTICYSATVSACEKGHEWQLALDLLSRMAEAKWMRTPFAIVRQSVPARRAKSGNSHWACSADGGSEMDADTICDSAAISACENSHGWQLALGMLSRMAKQSGSAHHLR